MAAGSLGLILIIDIIYDMILKRSEAIRRALAFERQAARVMDPCPCPLIGSSSMQARSGRGRGSRDVRLLLRLTMINTRG